jgi:hypothetical protein
MAKIEVSSLQGWIPLEYKPNPRANHIGQKNLRYSPIPKIFMPKKTQRTVYAKGKSVFELFDPDGHVQQAHDAQFPIESLANLGEQMKQLPNSWQCRTRALTEDLVLDLGPDKTIYAVGDEFHQYYTRIAETK